MKTINNIKQRFYKPFRDSLNEVKFLQARMLKENTREKGKLVNIQDAEFMVFSQFGDDGIIQYVVDRLNLPPLLHTFIEFGVENYEEANTRFLLMNNNWSGLVMDASRENIDYIKEDRIYWKHALKAAHKFVTTENVNSIIMHEGFSGDIGLLHIDIDGNDYWVWKSLSVIKPIIVIIEYNSIFGFKKAISIPYKQNFYRTKAHYSNLYWGASLKAFYDLAKIKGYNFVGTNSAGNNAYFIRKDYSSHFSLQSCKEGYTDSKYRESRDERGNLTFLSGIDRLKMIKDMSIVDVVSNKKIKLLELLK